MKKLYISLLLCMAVTLAYNTASAQGCVAVRQMGGVNPMVGASSYNLLKGQFQVGASYRYFHSWRHFVGKEEQPQRQTTGGGHGPDGKDRGNAVNIYSHALDFNISYGLTNRIQINASIPYVHNERSQVLRSKIIDTTRYSVFAKGLGDVRLGINYWVLDPAKAHRGNIMIGAGVKLATGKHDIVDDALQADGSKLSVIMDQAIQPGDGGVGVSLEFQGFRQIAGSVYGFANAYYLFNPKESNGTFKSEATAGLEGYNVYASPDQYFARAGLMAGIGKAQKLTVSLAGRLEGIPAYDAFGGNVAYRRPGYVIAIEPGITFRTGKHIISLFVPYNIVKNRIQSAADIASQNLQNSKITDETKKVHVQGDAAFADYSISLSYAFRFGGKKQSSH